MDEMVIKTGFAKGFISALLMKSIKKSMGIDINISINKLRITSNDDNDKFTVNADITLDGNRQELSKLLQ